MLFQSLLFEKLLRLFPALPPDPSNPHLWEIFKTEKYLNSSPDQKKSIHIHISQASYDYESDPRDSWLLKYFSDRVSIDSLKASTLLDLGSFCGGRLAYWTETYGLKKGLGIDINPIFKEMSEDFAEHMGIHNMEFLTGYGESLPYENDSIDFIVSTDVLEHVVDVEKTLSECHRVLKKGGSALIAFPQYLQPLEAHIGLFTKLPALHWFFPGKLIAKKIHKIYKDDPEAAWYLPKYPLEKWEKLYSLNGISARKFRKIVGNQKWSSADYSIRPLLSDGRKSRRFPFNILKLLFWLPAHIPFLDELFMGRVNVVLRK